MLLERFSTPGLAQVAYIVADPQRGASAVIDPRRDIDDYLTWALDHDMEIVAILETHVHADFVSGARQLAAATGAPIYAGRLGESAFPHVPINDGDAISIGRLRLEALRTPGHTPEHISYLLFDQAVGMSPVALFSGDALFAGEIGRPDLLGANKTGELVEQLYETVHQWLASLPENLVVYPGHGAGSPCGKKIGDAAHTTIGQEKRFNYAFQTTGLEQFARVVMDGMPKPPAYYPALKRINKAGPPLLGDLPGGRPVSADELVKLQKDGALLIDARTAAEFAVAHIAGSVNVGLGGSFAIWAGWLTPYDRQVVLILPNDECFVDAKTELHRIGVDEIAGYLQGGLR
ncbi:MAG: MBL fold metallo-hydrolase, partial [Chloroflexi bacterium]|nr:MBL fold metallo-hydrolase [Chloroflexota bacterium]